MFKSLLNKALFGSIKNQDYDTVRLSLQKGADPNSYHRGITPLMRACATGSDVLISMLIEAGADSSKRSKDGHFDTFEFCFQNGLEDKVDHINNCWSIYKIKSELSSTRTQSLKR